MIILLYISGSLYKPYYFKLKLRICWSFSKLFAGAKNKILSFHSASMRNYRRHLFYCGVDWRLDCEYCK